ncbi:hypothetical protein [Emticicia sp. 17c]|uniref:hypothetical protein n=1 Tax=Emticicia sp. 17c TaxID=3127704 RepID=UPI00301DB580
MGNKFIKIKIIAGAVISACLLNACIGPRTCLYYVSFTNQSDQPVQFGWGDKTRGKLKMVEVANKKSIDFSFWTDDLPLGSFPQDGDSVVIILANGKKIIDVKRCELLNGNLNCEQDSRSFFNPKAYNRYQSGLLNKSCGGVEYVFTTADAQRAR